MNMNEQILIPADSDYRQNFQNFYAGRNTALIADLKSLIVGNRNKPVLYLWGDSGSGKTHLLNACCQEASQIPIPAIYISLLHHPHVLDEYHDITENTVICIDDLQSVSGYKGLQTDLLVIYEAAMQKKGALILSGTVPPVSLGLDLKDLESRICYGGVYNILPLNDQEKEHALREHANYRGFELDEKVISFIMSHCQRDSRFLFNLLDNLDNESLRTQRKVTIPFLKTLL